MDEHLEQLVNELLSEGYAGGCSGPNAHLWIRAWVMAIKKVTQGDPYTDNLVQDCYDEISSLTT